MTTPDEERRSLLVAREFLSDLLDPTKTPRVPRAVRERARRVLRHYPTAPTVERLYRHLWESMRATRLDGAVYTSSWRP